MRGLVLFGSGPGGSWAAVMDGAEDGRVLQGLAEKILGQGPGDPEHGPGHFTQA